MVYEQLYTSSYSHILTSQDHKFIRAQDRVYGPKPFYVRIDQMKFTIS